MDRDCNRCVYSTREGGCRKFKCEGTKTVEDIKTDAIDDVLFILYDKGYINSDDEEYIKEQLKEQNKCMDL